MEPLIYTRPDAALTFYQKGIDQSEMYTHLNYSGGPIVKCPELSVLCPFCEGSGGVHASWANEGPRGRPTGPRSLSREGNAQPQTQGRRIHSPQLCFQRPRKRFVWLEQQSYQRNPKATSHFQVLGPALKALVCDSRTSHPLEDTFVSKSGRKRPPTEWEKIFANHRFERDLSPGYIKNCYNSVKTKKNNPILERAKVLRAISIEELAVASKHVRCSWHSSSGRHRPPPPRDATAHPRGYDTKGRR